jgi:hypothetical protein
LAGPYEHSLFLQPILKIDVHWGFALGLIDMSVWLNELSSILEKLGLCPEDEIITRPEFAELFGVNGPEASRLMKAFGGTEIGIARQQLLEVVLEMIAYTPETEESRPKVSEPRA